MKLSQARADFVRSQILAKLPDGGKGYEDKIRAVGFGETKLISKLDGTEDENASRRTIIEFQNNAKY